MEPDLQPSSYAPTILVVLGATGDLMARKIAPALLYLYKEQQLPSKFQVVGYARREFSDEAFRKLVAEALTKHADEQAPAEFLKLFVYQQGYFDQRPDYDRLNQKLDGIDKAWGLCTNKLFYLATPPDNYETIFESLASSKLTEPCDPVNGWTRVLVEKPFGNNLEHAEALDEQLNRLFKDEQVYRVDHYLAKEAVQNILAFRFSNNFLEPSWNRQQIEQIDIKLLEHIDIEGRGNFYDGVGALIDVGQNHLLQMLALVAMDQPPDYSAPTIRAHRAEVIESLASLTVEQIKAQTFRAQYAGYREEANVQPDSTTETYFRIKTSLRHPNWRGVPVYLEGGKKLPADDKQITVTYKHPSPCLCPPSGHMANNQLFIRIAPKPGIAIRFWAKQPGSKWGLEEQWLDFSYPMGESQRYLVEYAQLLSDAIVGDQTLFTSGREALASWRFIDPIVRAWRADPKPPPVYEGAEVFKQAKLVERPVPKGQVGIVGLGKMGGNMALRLAEQGWDVVGQNRSPRDPHSAYKYVANFADLARELKAPRVVWLFLPHDTVDDVLFGADGLAKHLEPGDIVMDGGNSYYELDGLRAKRLAEHDIKFMDVGVSGGPGGARHGACIMAGGEQADFAQVEQILADAATDQGYQFFSGIGAGHFVKMVHNGIEYGMMQALAEGFAIMKRSSYDLDLTRVAEVYKHGSVIESRLMEWLEQAFKLHGPELTGVSGSVAHTGEGKWTVQAAEELGLKAKVIQDALQFRVESEQHPDYTGQILSGLREQFGGHSVNK
jgi:glucose-6-phosphate 1-dehydrogenase